nr:cAMP-specific 3',5'-cyclic phosphodiesterase 4D-like isoform X1 [Dromaius novaehollandiae]
MHVYSYLFYNIALEFPVLDSLLLHLQESYNSWYLNGQEPKTSTLKLAEHFRFSDRVVMNKYTCTLHGRSKSVSEEALHHSTEDEDLIQGMEPYLVRRLSCRNIQLPPLAFRQLEQADWDKKSDTETNPRPTTLPLRIPPLIAITSAESSRLNSNMD